MADLAKKEPLIWLMINYEPTPQPRYPGGYSPVYSDFDSSNSQRNEVAVLRRQCIRKDVVSPKFKWRIQTVALNKLLNMITPERPLLELLDCAATLYISVYPVVPDSDSTDVERPVWI